jgi:shikimate dehydrogenase
MKLGVIGDPIAHSQSPALHREFLKQAAIEGSYDAILVHAGDVPMAIRLVRQIAYLGLNVTTPLKEEAYAACTELDERARVAGAVNTLTFLGDRVIGTTTDGIGAGDALPTMLPRLDRASIAVLGAGPTARAIMDEAKRRGARVALWNRTESRAAALRAKFAIDAVEFEQTYDAVFSTLPPDAELSDELIHMLTRSSLVIDANYGRRATLAKAIRRADVVDGIDMLIAQARASFAIWQRAAETAAVAADP